MKLEIRQINRWLIAILILTGLVYSFNFYEGNVFSNKILGYLINVRPSSIILWFLTIDAINIFSGKEAVGISLNLESISILTNVLLFLMIGPFLLVKGYLESEKKVTEKKPWYWYVGAIIVISALMIVPTEIVRTKMMIDTSKSSQESRIRDLMRKEITDVGFATAEHLILNKSEGKSFNLEDIKIDSFNYDFSIEGNPSDSLITIICTNPEQTTFSVKLDVYPDEEEVMRMRN